MKTTKYILIALLTSMVSSASSWEDAFPETKSAMVKKANEALGRVEAMFAKHGYLFERPNMEDASAERIDKFPGEGNRGRLNLHMPSALNMYFLPKDLEIIHFFYSAQREKIAYENSEIRIFKEKQKPKLSEEEAIAIAKEFAVAVLGKFPANVGKPVARWDVPGGVAAAPGEDKNKRRPRLISGYQHGYWRITWGRETEEGYPFYGEDSYIWIELYENVGPTFISANTVTQFDKVDFTPLKKEEVLDIARAKAKEIMKWKPTREKFEGLELDPEPAHSELVVVRPNHLTKRKSIPKDSEDIKGRLAWWVAFSCYAPGQERKLDNAQRAVIVWIDAENKKFLGGDMR